MTKCEFECIYNEDGECEVGGGECIGDMCESFQECQSCMKTEECEHVRESRR